MLRSVDAAVAVDIDRGIVCLLVGLRDDHDGPGDGGGTEAGGEVVGIGADRDRGVLVAHLCGNSAAGEVLRVDRASSRVAVAYAVHGELAGFPAHLGFHYVVRDFEAWIRFPFVDLFHDLPPDILVEGVASVF